MLQMAGEEVSDSVLVSSTETSTNLLQCAKSPCGLWQPNHVAQYALRWNFRISGDVFRKCALLVSYFGFCSLVLILCASCSSLTVQLSCNLGSPPVAPGAEGTTLVSVRFTRVLRTINLDSVTHLSDRWTIMPM